MGKRKNILVSVLIILCTAVVSCKKIDEISKVNVPLSRTFPIPTTSVEQIPIDITSPKVSTADNVLNNNVDLEGDRIESVKLKSMELSIDESFSSTLSYLENIELYFLADDLDPERIAWADDISPDVGKTLELQTSSVDIISFIKEDSIRIRLVGQTDELIEEEHELTVSSVMEIDVKLLGQ